MKKRSLSSFKNKMTISLVSLVILPLAAFSPLSHASVEDGVLAYNSKNYQKAYQEFMSAAEMGNAQAQFRLANMFTSGIGVDKNKIKAHYWYLKSAEQGEPEAQYNLGLMYWEGDGQPTDKKEGLVWLERSANKNYALAQYNLGVIYLNGSFVLKSRQKAYDWFTRAAQQNHPQAQYNLGMLYLEDQKPFEALNWLNRAAQNKDLNAQYNLGVIYKEGRPGIRPDLLESYKWFSIAASRGDAASQKALVSLQPRLSKQEVAAASERAVQWSGRYGK